MALFSPRQSQTGSTLVAPVHFPRWRVQGQPDQHLLSGGGCSWEGALGRTETPTWPSESKGCAPVHLKSALCLFSALLSTWRLRQRVGRYQRTGPETPHQSERLKFYVVLIRVSSSFVSHRSFTAPMLHLWLSPKGSQQLAMFVTL